MPEITEAEHEAIIAENETLLDVLIVGYRRFKEQDRTDGVDSEESALGGVGMTLEAIGYDRLPHNLMMLVCLAVRRLAKVQGDTDG